MAITLGRTAARVAWHVRNGGTVHDAEIRDALNIHRCALTRAWEALEALGALTITPAPLGRPRADQPGREVTINRDSWVWAAVEQGVGV